MHTTKIANRGSRRNNTMVDGTDEDVEKNLKKTRKSADPYLNSIDPPGLEGTGLGKNNEEFIEFERGEEKEELRKESDSYSEDSFAELPSDKKVNKRKGKADEIKETSTHE